MGGGLCRSSDVFADSLPLAISTALPLSRSFLHDAVLTADTDPWLLSSVQSFLSPALAASLSLPPEQRKQRALAQSLFDRYHHAPTATLSQPQLAALVSDYLTAAAAHTPPLIAAVLSDSHRQLLTLIAHHHPTQHLTRTTRHHIDTRIAAVDTELNALVGHWLDALRGRVGELAGAVWVRLVERGQGRGGGGGGGGVVESVFVEHWQAVSDEVMQLKQFSLQVPWLLDDQAEGDAAEERKEAGRRGVGADGGVEDSERVDESRTVVEVITVEESLRMRHGSISESRQSEPPSDDTNQ